MAVADAHNPRPRALVTAIGECDAGRDGGEVVWLPAPAVSSARCGSQGERSGGGGPCLFSECLGSVPSMGVEASGAVCRRIVFSGFNGLCDPHEGPGIWIEAFKAIGEG